MGVSLTTPECRCSGVVYSLGHEPRQFRSCRLDHWTPAPPETLSITFSTAPFSWTARASSYAARGKVDFRNSSRGRLGRQRGPPRGHLTPVRTLEPAQTRAMTQTGAPSAFSNTRGATRTSDGALLSGFVTTVALGHFGDRSHRLPRHRSTRRQPDTASGRVLGPGRNSCATKPLGQHPPTEDRGQG
jgi:hypothetical protein